MEQNVNTKITVVKPVCRNGGSLAVHITKELGIMGLGLGDLVEITIKKVE